LRGSSAGLVALGAGHVPIPLDGLAVDFAFYSDQGVEELIGYVGKDGGPTRGDAVLHDQDKELGEELVDLVGGLEIVEPDQEVGGEINVDRLRRLDLQCGMTETEAGAECAQTAAAAACGEMDALVFRIGNDSESGGTRSLIHGLSFLNLKLKGVHPRGDRKSSEGFDSKGVARALLSKRVCMSMKTISLQACNKKQTSYGLMHGKTGKR
jgi:hypothetical protein